MDFGNNVYHHQHHHSFVPQNGSEDTQLTLNQNSNGIQKEHMFDKVVTPSDVGKLNRLVIPKQHAEKHFPLDSSSNEKGLLLNFEDRIGKPWRFRYSYWNSSQSYVMTKGWSRFVKDKRLDAGDIVSFHRGVGEFFKDRLFIDWRRRVVPPEISNSFSFHHPNHHRSSIPWNPMFLRPPPNQMYNTLQNANMGSIIYLRSAPPITLQHDLIEARQRDHIREEGQGLMVHDHPIVFDSIPVAVQGKEVTKTLRLFGVNMECGVSSSSEASESSSRVYNDVVVPFQSDHEFVNKGKSSSMSLDFDI